MKYELSKSEAIELLASKYNENKKGVKSKEYLEKVGQTFGEVSSSKFGLKSFVLYPAAVKNAICYGVSQAVDRRRRVSTIAKILGCDKSLIAGELNEYLENKCVQPFFADDMTYKAYVSDEGLETLSIIWGDADLRSVRDLTKLKSLKMVLGDLYLSTQDSLEGLDSLQYVGGDVKLTKVSSLEGLNPELFVGGKVIADEKEIKRAVTR